MRSLLSGIANNSSNIQIISRLASRTFSALMCQSLPIEYSIAEAIDRICDQWPLKRNDSINECAPLFPNL
jgi:hypothetical protein